MNDSEFQFLRGLVYEHSRISLGADKRSLLTARINKRVRARSLDSIGDYCRLLKSPALDEELDDLIDAISTNHTAFFRENAHFDYLRNHILPEKARSTDPIWRTPLRTWSAASSSGEEPYSLAITLAETLPNEAWEIDATDISHRILKRAQDGIYRDDTVRSVPRDLLPKYFQRGLAARAGYYRVRQELRSRVNFSQLNLLGEEFPPGPYHVIFCRNVMIYFDKPTQQELIARLTSRLVPGGYLFVGHSESLTGIKHTLHATNPATYQKGSA